MLTGVQNTVEEAWDNLENLITNRSITIEQIRQNMTEFIDNYIQEKIIFA